MSTVRCGPKGTAQQKFQKLKCQEEQKRGVKRTMELLQYIIYYMYNGTIRMRKGEILEILEIQ